MESAVIWSLLIKFLEVVGKARSTIERAKSKNKVAQEVNRIKADLTMLEENWNRSLTEWGPIEIFSSVLVLESSTKTGKRIVVTSLKRKYFLVRSIFQELGLSNFDRNRRTLKMALQEHIKNRIDRDVRPSPDRAAPLLSPSEWLMIQEWLMENIEGSTSNFTNKRHMAMLSASLGFSTGLRLTELHRLKFSDVDWDQPQGVRLRIRRSKSNRDGRKLVWQMAPIHRAEKLLCPVHNFIWYLKGTGKEVRDDAYVFSDDKEGLKQTRIENLKNYWVLAAKNAGLPKEKWPKAHSHHCCKINLARALGYSEEAIVDSMNWQSVSVLQEYLRNANQNKDGVAFELTSMTAKELTERTSHLW